jgi:hypothetical protein
MTDISRQILRSAAEDAFGLYEVLWELRSQHPDKSDDELRAIAIDEIRSLLDHGWIQLCKRPWHVSEASPDAVEVIHPQDWDSVLSDSGNWREPRWNLYVAVIATDEGYLQLT